MSEKVNKAIEVIYQAAGAVTGLVDVKMDVYDETHALDAAKGVAALTEIGTTGRYYGVFTPDVEGEWQVHIDSIVAPGKSVKHYTVVAHDVDSVGDDVAAVDGKVDTVDGKVVTVDGKIDALNDIAASDVTGGTTVSTAESNIRGGSESLETIKNAVDGISPVSAPIIG